MSTNPPESIMQRIEALAVISESTTHLTRRYLSPEHARANDLVETWMRDAGMTTRIDAVGNITGRYEGNRPNAPVLLFGSHLDTVANAGRYDGMLGVLTPIACVEALNAADERFDFAIEVVGFADEEGLRFQSTLLGSRALAGTFDMTLLDRLDVDGISMRDALKNFGLDSDAITSAARKPDELLAYVELHIEQGPVLEANERPVGVVSAISGATRLEVRVKGEAGHAGTVPMALRRDALTAAASMALAIEARCMTQESLVGTVGRFETSPGAVNVIPGDVLFSIDIRAGDDATRAEAVREVREKISAIARERHVEIEITTTHENSSCECAAWLIEQLSASVYAQEVVPMVLASGAGHDAMAMADVTDVGMLFVRCEGGISHNPAEEILAEDADVGRDTLLHFIRNFSH